MPLLEHLKLTHEHLAELNKGLEQLKTVVRDLPARIQEEGEEENPREMAKAWAARKELGW